MTAPAHSLSISTGLRKVNAHAKIRLNLLTWPYVESCTGGGILPYVGVAAKLESQVKPIAFWVSPLQSVLAEAGTASRNNPRSEVARCWRVRRYVQPSAAK